MRRAVAWVLVQASRLCLLWGGLCVLALVVAIVSYLFGEREFPELFSNPVGEDAPLGTYVWQLGVNVVGAYVV